MRPDGVVDGIESADRHDGSATRLASRSDAVRDTVRSDPPPPAYAPRTVHLRHARRDAETVKTTSDFILSLDLDKMNMTSSARCMGAPIWDECVSGVSGGR